MGDDREERIISKSVIIFKFRASEAGSLILTHQEVNAPHDIAVGLIVVLVAKQLSGFDPVVPNAKHRSASAEDYITYVPLRIAHLEHTNKMRHLLVFGEFIGHQVNHQRHSGADSYPCIHNRISIPF
jgi:hypothetical protein